MPILSSRTVVSSLAAGLIVVGGCRSAPPYQGMTAADIHAVAEREFEEGDWEDAIEALDRILVSFPNYERTPEVRFMLARAHFEEEEYITASSEYQRLLDRYPGHALAPDAALGNCRSYAELSPVPQRDQSYTRQALTVCRNVVVDFQGHSVARQAAEIAQDMRNKIAASYYEVGEYYFDRDLYDSAIIYWAMVDEQYGDTPWAPRAVLGIVRAYQEIGYEDLEEEFRNRLLNVYPDSDAARELSADNGGPVGS